jgi:predicted metal-binding membrane protein
VTETNATGARRGPFLAVSALLFAASAAGTILWSRAMPEGMAMPGGWTLSMAWLPMPGETRLAAAAGFLAMWVAMMGAMMMPSLVPTLARDRPALEAPGLAPDGLGRAGAGYFAVWAVVGAAVYVVGTALVAAELRWPALAPAIPIARGVVLVAAGWVQLTPWKARHLACCREGRPGAARSGAAWRRGINLGIDCVLCCVPFMTLLVVTGMMNLATIALTALAITVERVAREPALVVRLAGLLLIGAGAWDIVRASGAVSQPL